MSFGTGLRKPAGCTQTSFPYNSLRRNGVGKSGRCVVAGGCERVGMSPESKGLDLFGALGRFRLVSLSHPVSPEMPHWPGDPSTEFEGWSDSSKHGYFLRKFSMEGPLSGGLPYQRLKAARRLQKRAGLRERSVHPKSGYTPTPARSHRRPARLPSSRIPSGSPGCR